MTYPIRGDDRATTLTIREWYVGQALVMHSSVVEGFAKLAEHRGGGHVLPALLAESACRLADAILAALAAPTPAGEAPAPPSKKESEAP